MSDTDSEKPAVAKYTSGTLPEKDVVQHVVVRLLQSRKFVVLLLLSLVGGVLVGMGKVSWSEFMDALKWIAGTFIASVAVEDFSRHQV